MEKRQDFITDCLAWGGHVRNSYLRNEFSISSQRVSDDINKFYSNYPDSIYFDVHSKLWRANKKFPESLRLPFSKAIMRTPYISRLVKLEQVESGFVAWNFCNDMIIFELVHAIRLSFNIDVLFIFDKSSKPKWITIMPHSLFSGKLHAYIRSYCYEDDSYISIRLDLITKTRVPKSIYKTRPMNQDKDWNEYVPLRLGPYRWHPQFDKISRTFGSSNSKGDVLVRKVFYELIKAYLDDLVSI